MSHLKTLKSATSLHDVAHILGLQPKALSYILYKIPAGKKYSQFEIPKRSGGKRQISAPTEELKMVQGRLSVILQDCIEEINKASKKKEALSHGFRRKHSIISNAWNHRRKQYVFNMDLENYFGTINFGRVRGFFIKNRNFELNLDVATVLAQIACFDNSLPQGSPCSPVISNLIGHALDMRLEELARKNGCRYSRYADDLTFSTNRPTFPSSLALLDPVLGETWKEGKQLSKAVAKCGFAINASKTRMQYRRSRQDVTGLVVNAKVSVRDEYCRLARQMVHRLIHTGKYQRDQITIDASGSPATKKVDGKVSELRGILSFIDSVDKYNREKLVLKVKEADKLNSRELVYRRFLYFTEFHENDRPVIVCEGKTDNIYLKAAIAQCGGPLTKSKVRFFKYTNTTKRILALSGGAGNLCNFIAKYAEECKKFSGTKAKFPVIVVTDNDAAAKNIFSTASKVLGGTVVDGSDSFYFLSLNLYLVSIPKIGGKETIIEHFFDPALLKEKLNGKIFNPSDHIDIKKEYGKSRFAEHIVRKNQNNIDFKSFKEILTRIESAIDDYASKI